MRRYLTALSLGLSWVVVVFAGQSPAQSSAQANQPPQVIAPGAAFILGRVIEVGTTSGVSNAVVTLSGPALGSSTAKFTNGTPGGPRRAFADGQGQFLFRDLPAGAYSISSTAAGYVDAAYGQQSVVRRALDPARPLEIAESDRRVAATIPMWKMGGIAGRVTDEAGEPMVDVPITLLARTSEWGSPVIKRTAIVMTDDRGLYHADVEPGDYIIGLIAATTTVPASAVDGFQQAQRQGGATMQAYMSQVVGSGSLLPRGVGARVGNFMVSQFGARNTSVVPPFMSRNGQLSFYPTTFHPSALSGGSASVVTLGSGEEKTGIDLRVRFVPARRVSGRVVGPSGPVANIALRLLAPDSAVTGSQSVTNDVPQALSDGNGEFTFLGIAPGAYIIRVLREPTTDAEPALWAADPVAVSADTDLTDLQVKLQAGATIGGRVVVDGSGPPPAPAALRAITVRPVPVPGSAAALMGVFLNWVVRPDENGRFLTRQVATGSHMVVVTALPAGWILKSVTAGGRNAVDGAFEVSMSGVDDMVVTITNRISTLTGTVRDGNGMTVSLATVAVFPADKSLWPPPGIASRRIQTVTPARDGRYSFRGLPAGEYLVVAADVPADFSDGQVRTAFGNSAFRVTISDGETATQDVRLAVKR